MRRFCPANSSGLQGVPRLAWAEPVRRGDGSGDIMLAFSTHSDQAPDDHGVCRTEYLAQHTLDPLFLGVVEAVEESILNALIAARTMVGRNNTRVEALDHSMLVDLMRRHGRLAETR